MSNNRVEREKRVWEKIAKSYDNNTKIYEKAYMISIEKIKNILI